MYSQAWADHIKHLREVLSILKLHQFYIKLSKCDFGKETVEYLGHVISGHGVEVDHTKIAATEVFD